MDGNQAEIIPAFIQNIKQGASVNRIKFLSSRAFSVRIALIALLSVIMFAPGAGANEQVRDFVNSRALVGDDPDNMILDGADADDEPKTAGIEATAAPTNSAGGDDGVAAPTPVAKATGAKPTMTSYELEDVKARYEKGTYKLIIDGITPRGGPMYGSTRVTIRAEGIAALVDAYPEPRCKFGSNSKIVEADYVKCSTAPATFYAKEKQSGAKGDTCIQCEAAPKSDTAEIIPLTVSLTGKFDDTQSSHPYRYYEPLVVKGIYPRYGPKDGDSVIQVWGEHFLDLGDDFRCNFGSKSTQAHFINSNYIWCRSAVSDVVGRAMPFSVSLNRQQNSLQPFEFWFYNMQSLAKLSIDYGPITGDQKISLKGSNFLPFDWKADVDNQNDTFCAFGPLGKTPAHVISSTEAECLTPRNHLHLSKVPIKFSINNQNYTDEEVEFTYYNPPNVLDAGPLLGPAKGGTDVDLWGTKFERKNITCMFGKIAVIGKFISKEHIVCTTPPVTVAGDYQLVIKYQDDRFQSDFLNFKFFANPEVLSLDPPCGPVEGMTQISIRGNNFNEFQFGAAKCLFNLTNAMNATVVNSNEIVCDTPMLEGLNGDLWYNVSVTLDGDYISNSEQKFKYYQQPTMRSVLPSLGPMSGGTNSTITGTGFGQENICALRVRYEQEVIAPVLTNGTSMSVLSPAVNVSGAVVVSISGNNQQFINDRTLHFRDKENTFEYYQNFIVEDIVPTFVSNTGGTPLSIQGMQFDQFKNENGTERNVNLLCRFIDASNNTLGTPRTMRKVSGTALECVAPAVAYSGDARLEVGVNGEAWHDSGLTLKYFSGPRVKSVHPPNGVTKNPKGLNLAISGDNFICPAHDCSNIKVRFTNAGGDAIFEDGSMSEAGTVICKIPKYPAPETLDVDVTFNGLDYTNDGITYGFTDPYILGVSPRMISAAGTTMITLSGYGFVQLDDQHSVVVVKDQKNEPMQCTNSICTQIYKVQDEHTATIKTFAQTEMMTKDASGTATNVGFTPFFINMMNPDGDWSKNQIDISYYKDVEAKTVSTSFAYSNEEKPVVVATEFFWKGGNNYKNFAKYAKFTCRFTSTSTEKPKSVVSPAIMETSPIGAYKKGVLPDQIRCRTPRWGYPDQTTLEFSINDHDYFGSTAFTFVDKLEIYRIAPLSGPLGGNTPVKIYGTGLLSSIPATTEVFVKFGGITTEKIDKSAVTDFTWSSDEYHDDFNFPETLLHSAELNDKPLEEGRVISRYVSAHSPDITSSYIDDHPYTKGLGGPVYVQVGERVLLKEVQHSNNRRRLAIGQETTDPVPTTYFESSNLEFYYYRDPVITKIEPASGLTSGGTALTITGAWFQQKPEYGVFPFCKIGENVVRARFIQSNRIICKSPPSNDTSASSPILVSLNGVDWKDSGFHFSYYERPVIVDLQPRSGSADGGTELWLKGVKFSNVTHAMKTVQCRFRQILNSSDNYDDTDVPTKFIPAYYIDRETMKCATPSGWTGGDQVKVDLTFNGFDYTEASYIFSFYNIFGSFPKSGPADADHQYIQVRGKGFRPESTILCELNKVQVAPMKIDGTVIRCPMVLENWPADKYESVPFSILIDGSRKDFGQFHYFRQLVIDDVSPSTGPNEGKGAIYFMGKDFRDDFENAKLGCRIGNTVGKAELIDSETIRCTLSTKLPFVDEGQSLPVSVSLNSYSWAASEFSFTPYGIDALYPSSGPISENTNILVTGKGFENELKDQARCKFGTDDNYVIVEAQVLDNEHMICKSPSEQITLPDGADEVISLPFSIAFQEDLYYPYTEGPQKFRLYRHPTVIDSTPKEADIGKLTEVYVTASETEPFWQPTPAAGDNAINNDQYGIKCKFGRFGSSTGTYVNQTTILCLTPNIADDPEDISSEAVAITVAMNGVDYNDEYSQTDFTFNGTGGVVSTWVIIMGTLIFGLLIVSVAIFLSGLQELSKQRGLQQDQRQSYVQQRQDGGVGPRVNSRAASRSNQVGSRANLSRAGGSRLSRGNAGSRGPQPRFGGGNGGPPGGAQDYQN